MKLTKAMMKERIIRAVEQSEIFGNDIVDVADAWRTAIDTKIGRMRKEELKVLYDKSLAVNVDFDEEVSE